MVYFIVMAEYFIKPNQIESSVVDCKKQKVKDLSIISASRRYNINQLLTLILMKYSIIDSSIKGSLEKKEITANKLVSTYKKLIKRHGSSYRYRNNQKIVAKEIVQLIK